MKSEWYWNFAGKVVGPIGLDILKQFFDRGLIESKTFVLLKGTSNWRRVDTITELYAGGMVGRLLDKYASMALGSFFFRFKSELRYVLAGMSREHFEATEAAILNQLNKLLFHTPKPEIEIDHTELLNELQKLNKKFPLDQPNYETLWMREYQKLLKRYPWQADKFEAELGRIE